MGEVQPLGDPERLLVVAEMAAVVRGELRVERRLSRVPERRVARVVPEPDRLDEILVESQGARHDPGDAGRLEGVRHPRPVVVAGRVDEDLRLALQAPERLGMDDPVAVALERGADVGFRLGTEPAACLVRADRERRKPFLLGLAHPFLERGRPNFALLGHLISVSAPPVYPARPAEGNRGLCEGVGSERRCRAPRPPAGTSNTVRWISASRYSRAAVPAGRQE